MVRILVGGRDATQQIGYMVELWFMKYIVLIVFALTFAAIEGESKAAENTVKIDRAAYGMGSDVDATSGVGKLCNGKASCSFRVEPNIMGVTDPNPNTKKLLRISWSCGTEGKPSVQMYDYDTVDLSCK